MLCLSIILLMSSCSSAKNDNAIADATEQSDVSSDETIEEIVKDNKIETEWFTLEVPDNWTGTYTYEEKYNDEIDEFSLEVSMKSKSENGNAFLFSIEISPLEDADYIVTSLEYEWLDPIGIITTDNGTAYFVSSYLASEAACTDDEMEQFAELANGIDQCLSTFKPKYDEQFQEWNDKLFEELKSSIETTPYVPYTLNILDWNFEAYKNQSGIYFHDITNQVISDYYLINQLDGVSYYSGDNVLVAVENESIVALAYIPSADSRFGSWSTTPTVRDVINAEELTELFNVAPEVLSVDGDAVCLYSWRIDNGYIGIKAIGSTDPQWLYDNSALVFMVYSDKKFCSLYN